MMSDLTNFDLNFSKKLYFVEKDKKVPKIGFEAKKWATLTLILLQSLVKNDQDWQVSRG